MAREILDVIMSKPAVAAHRAAMQNDKRLTHFLQRRIPLLVTKPNWNTAPYTALAARLDGEIRAIAQYLQERLGTKASPGPLGGARDAADPMLTDISDFAKVYVDDGPEQVKALEVKQIDRRRRRVEQIVWRALAIHPELWSEELSPAPFKRAALDEVLHRRLQFAERMIYTDNVFGLRRGDQQWQLAAYETGWTDGRRTTIFEYPFINLRGSNFAEAVRALGQQTGRPGLTPQQLGTRFAKSTKEQLRARSRIAPPAEGDWQRAIMDGTYAFELRNVRSATDAFDDLVPATSPLDPSLQDFWSRHWMYCDHMAAALAVDALRFGLQRRTGGNAAFNTAAAAGVFLEALIGGTTVPNVNDLMGQGGQYFEGAMITPSNLQVGDHVVLWNNHFSRAILGSDFGLENAVVTAIDGEDARACSMVGHGVGESSYKGAMHAVTSDVRDTVTGLQKLIAKNALRNVRESFLIPTIERGLVMPWNPYGERFEATFKDEATGEVFKDAAGNELVMEDAWWIRIKLAETATGNGSPLPLEEALRRFPRSISPRPGQAAVDLPPSEQGTEAIYLPLTVPRGYKGGWPTYFAEREANRPGPPHLRLDGIMVDSDWAPGLFYRGPDSEVPVVRPRIRL